MFSTRKKMAVVFIIAILIFAIIAYAFYRPSDSSSETAAQSMILDDEDLGTPWQGHSIDHRNFPSIPNLDSIEQMEFYKSNESDLIVGVFLLVFVNSSSCNEYFEKEEAELYEYLDVNNLTSIPLGDDAFYYDANKWNASDIGWPAIAFIRGPVYCLVWVHPYEGPQLWYGPVLTEITNIQLKKIDRYLGP